MTKHVTVATEVQAEVANRINQYSLEVSGLLVMIAQKAEGAIKMQEDNYSVSPNVNNIISKVDSLGKAQAKLDSYAAMAHMVGLTTEEIQIAATPVRAWFHTETPVSSDQAGTDWQRFAQDVLNDDQEALIARLPEPIRTAFADTERAEKEAGQ